MGIDGYKFEEPEDVKQFRERLKEIEEHNKKLFSGFTFEPSEQWKQFKKQISDITEERNRLMQPVYDALNDSWNKTLRSFRKMASELSEKLENLAAGFSFKIPDALKTVDIIEKEQYVFWDYLTQSFIDDIINSDDVESTLLQYEAANDFALSEKIIKECAAHPYLQSNLRPFCQVVEAYREGKYDLAVIGFTTVIDGVLTEATGNITHYPMERYKTIIERLKVNEYVEYEEYAIITLGTTFFKTAESFYKSINFSDPEPESLNRNWIMHGRSQREKTRLDCIKLLRFLYGIILVSRIDEQAIEEASAEEKERDGE